MKIRSFILPLLAMASASAAVADDSVSITLTGTVAPRCELSGFVRQTAGENSTAIGIGFDVNTGVVGATQTSSSVEVDTTAPQLLADVTARCNTLSATLDVSTDNDFNLVNSGASTNNEIPFRLNLLGQGGQSGISSDFTTTINGTGPNLAQVRPLEFALQSPADPVTLAPGTYSDTIRITLTPNP